MIIGTHGEQGSGGGERILTGAGIIYHYGLWSVSWVIKQNESRKRE